MKKPAVIAVLMLIACFTLLACGGSNSGNSTGGGGGSSTGTPVYVSNSSSPSVSFYLLDQTSGTLQRGSGSPVLTGGSSPDSLAFDPAKKFFLVSNASSSTLSVFSVNSTTAALTPVSGSPFAAGANAARLIVHPRGNFVYGLSSTPAEILAYSFNSTTGSLASVAGFPLSLSTSGQSGLAISPNGQFLYTSNPNTNLITGFSIGTDGTLTQLAATTSPSKGSPVFLTFDSSGLFLFAVNAGGNLGGPSVSTFSISATGALTDGSRDSANKRTFCAGIFIRVESNLRHDLRLCAYQFHRTAHGAERLAVYRGCTPSLTDHGCSRKVPHRDCDRHQRKRHDRSFLDCGRWDPLSGAGIAVYARHSGSRPGTGFLNRRKLQNC